MVYCNHNNLGCHDLGDVKLDVSPCLRHCKGSDEVQVMAIKISA